MNRQRHGFAFRDQGRRRSFAGANGRVGQTRRSGHRGVSGPALVYILCLGLMIGWFGPDWTARISVPQSLFPTATPHQSMAADALSAQFGFCHSGGGSNCVVDGDTFWFRGDKYRIADIDTPETHGPRCEAEGVLGARATQQLQTLLNAGPFSLASGDRDSDRYGRALRVVTRKGQSIGEQLVAEGLARSWDGARHPWC
nr:thermonuclease family protein [Sphingobium sp. KCTC 72723]